MKKLLFLILQSFFCLALAQADGLVGGGNTGDGIISIVATATPTATPTPAALFNFTGFENGDTAEAVTTSGVVSIVNVSDITIPVHTGTYSLRSNPSLSSFGYFSFAGHSATGATLANIGPNLYARFWFRYKTGPAANSEPIAHFHGQFHGPMATLRMSSIGEILVYQQDGTLDDTGTSSVRLTINTWYVIEMHFTEGTTPYEVRIRDSSLTLLDTISGTGDFNATLDGTESLRLGKTVNANGNTVDFFYDDVAISTAGWPSSSGVTKNAPPNAAGSSSNWTAGTGASNYLEVDEVAADNDTTYIQTTGSNSHYVALMDSSTLGASGQINAVKVRAKVREALSGTSSVRVGVKSGATTSETSGVNTTTSYSQLFKVFATDPNTSANWTLSAFDALEAGVNEANIVGQRCTTLDVQVEYSN